MGMMIALIVTVLVAGCSTMVPYWSRPGGTRSALVEESTACYRASIDDDAYPAALPGPGSAPRLLPRSEPPPALWMRAPREAGLERYDEQLRYERCMHARGWMSSRPAR